MRSLPLQNIDILSLLYFSIMTQAFSATRHSTTTTTWRDSYLWRRIMRLHRQLAPPNQKNKGIRMETSPNLNPRMDCFNNANYRIIINSVPIITASGFKMFCWQTESAWFLLASFNSCFIFFTYLLSQIKTHKIYFHQKPIIFRPLDHGIFCLYSHY